MFVARRDRAAVVETQFVALTTVSNPLRYARHATEVARFVLQMPGNSAVEAPVSSLDQIVVLTVKPAKFVLVAMASVLRPVNVVVRMALCVMGRFVVASV
jgi:hypothetical protein